MGNAKSQPGRRDQVDGSELYTRNLRSSHRPATADGKKKKKTSPKFLDGETLGVLNSWVSQNIRKKECVSFILRDPGSPNAGDICCCGHTKDLHFQDPSVSPVTPGAIWDPQKHVREFPSDAHGDLTFSGTSKIWAKYVRASSDTNPRLLFELMTQQWGLSIPSLLISVTGGAKNFNINPRLKNQFSRGLVTAAQSTGAWIITGGSHAGVMKHVGEAVRDFSDSEIVLIGIATWGIVHNRRFLLSEAGGAPAVYPMDEGSQGDLCCLDNNHTHFILVDDGSHGRYGVEIPLRTKLEKFISEQTMEKGGTAIKIPIVCVVLEGGPGTLDTIYNSMCNNTPCVIVEGSGRVADIIAQVSSLSPSRITIALVKEKLQNLFGDTYSNFSQQQIIMWTKKIQDIVRMGSLLTVLREERAGEQGMDVAILQALLKASRSTDHYGQENWDHQLKLAVSWNRPDIAETQIFTDDWSWKPADLHPSLMISLIDNKPSFVRLFLERGITLSEFLSWETLTYLYNNTEQPSLIHSKLGRQVALDGSRDFRELPIQLHHVSRVLQELLGDFTDPLYPETRSRRARALAQVNIKMNGKVSSWKESLEPVSHHLEHPERDLLIWCIVQNRAELADIVWSLSPDCVVAALACSKILKALSKEEEDTESKQDMMALADVYEERAMGVFSECYRNDERRAELLLIHVSPKWGKTTCLELAQESQGRLFMSQGGVQMFLTKTWWGKLSVENGFIQIILCMLFFPLIYSGLITYRMDSRTPQSLFKNSMNGFGQRTQNSIKSQHRAQGIPRAPAIRGPRPYSCFWKFLVFFNAPVVKFYYNVVSYVGFLWLFAYVLMIDFQTYPSWREYLLYAWVLSILSEELRQLFYDPDQLGFITKSIQYISEFWNRVDTLALGLFAVGLICRLVGTDTVYLGRVFLSLDFMIFCIRLMHIFTVSKVLGPKIIILRRMVKDIFFFLFLLAIWIISYGVAKQSILVTNEPRLYWIFRNVIYEPYLTLFGQIATDVDGLNFDPSKCTENATNSTLPKCVLNDGAGNALFPEWLTIILMCLYLLLANILLLNLLIAMFSYTFGDVESHTDQVWKFYRFGLIKEYNERPAAPPPFILFSHFYIVCKYVLCKHPTRSHKVLRWVLDETAEASLLSWESYMRDNYEESQQQLNKQSQEYLVKDTAESVSAVLGLLKIERGSAGHQLEGRLSVLEEQVAQSSHYLKWIISALTEKGFSSKTRILVHSSSLENEDKAVLGAESLGERASLYHVNARIMQYPLSKVSRYPVPDEMVPWEVEFPGYDPPLYIAVRNDRGSYDPNYEISQKNRKYNALDGIYDFRSSCGIYIVKDGLPLNPMGRTGLTGVGSLRWFGPNHSLHPVLTRWSLNFMDFSPRKMSRKMLDVLVVKHKNNELWALPGGTLDPGQKIPPKLRSILKTQYLSEFLALLGGGTEVFRGYLDDPRNTDNSWIETQAVNVHLESLESMERLQENLQESNSEISLRWQLLDRKIPLYANEKEILQRTAEHLGAHY
ncbi:transient receptor potential cation channel subfamily M member 2-like [Spea bombifrons]|uniref:transient receptor potential cation channel subfamily M member 2-like n=1 Tax=Spea bombifrons TaxID=233779 RepID=UPI00234902E7|nr:transient receptor potential cation channel subfamily M member 2-like [Spea bombifrons]